jgi:hypothetical protein
MIVGSTRAVRGDVESEESVSIRKGITARADVAVVEWVLAGPNFKRCRHSTISALVGVCFIVRHSLLERRKTVSMPTS